MSSDTKTSANNASHTGLPDSCGEPRQPGACRVPPRIFAFNTAMRAHRSSTGTRAQARCATRAFASNCGTANGDVRSNDPQTRPVAGSIDATVSTVTGIATIFWILAENRGHHLLCSPQTYPPAPLSQIPFFSSSLRPLRLLFSYSALNLFSFFPGLDATDPPLLLVLHLHHAQPLRRHRRP